MGWPALAAVAAPYVAAAFLPRPGAPQYRDPGLPTDRSNYINQLLQTGFSDQSPVWQRASAMAEDRVNRMLGRSGMAGSSIGGQLHSMTQSDLAAKFLEDAINRQGKALAPVLTYDNNIYNARAGAAQGAYQSAVDAFNRANQNNAGTIQGLSGMINAGMGYYQGQQAYDQRQAQLNQNQQIIDSMRSQYSPQPVYGVPGYQQMPGAGYMGIDYGSLGRGY